MTKEANYDFDESIILDELVKSPPNGHTGACPGHRSGVRRYDVRGGFSAFYEDIEFELRTIRVGYADEK
jgi:hypothetical protein